MGKTSKTFALRHGLIWTKKGEKKWQRKKI